jgi:hypothetical protein
VFHSGFIAWRETMCCALLKHRHLAGNAPQGKNLPPILGQKFMLTDLCTCTNRAHTSHMYMYMCLAKLSGDGWYCRELQLSQILLISDVDNFSTQYLLCLLEAIVPGKQKKEVASHLKAQVGSKETDGMLLRPPLLSLFSV